MINTKTLSLLGLISPFLLFACSDDNDGKEAAPLVKSGILKTSLVGNEEVRIDDMTSAACSRDPDSGLFKGFFTSTSGESLDIKLKDFTTSPKTYTCLQAESNRDGDLGEKYTGCAIEFTLQNPVKDFDSYATYRTSEGQDAFTYSGQCTVTTTYLAPKLTLTVDCKNVIQTMVKSRDRNPIDPDVYANATGTVVECALN